MGRVRLRTDDTARHAWTTLTSHINTQHSQHLHTYPPHGTHRDRLTDRTRKRMPTRERRGDGRSDGATVTTHRNKERGLWVVGCARMLFTHPFGPLTVTVAVAETRCSHDF
eukprot:scaffold88683_cov34-Tisochrysis_lutea.AAC.1